MIATFRPQVVDDGDDDTGEDQPDQDMESDDADFSLLWKLQRERIRP